MVARLAWNDEKARRLVLEAHAAYRAHTHLYTNVHAMNGDAPQHKYIPSGVTLGSPEHVLFLFFATMLTYRSLSEMGFKQAVDLYEKKLYLFSETAASLSEKELYAVFKEVGFVHPSQVAKNWPRVVDELFKTYGGNPLAIFEKGEIGRASCRERVLAGV